jgi:hypothetical protein
MIAIWRDGYLVWESDLHRSENLDCGVCGYDTMRSCRWSPMFYKSEQWKGAVCCFQITLSPHINIQIWNKKLKIFVFVSVFILIYWSCIKNYLRIKLCTVNKKIHIFLVKKRVRLWTYDNLPQPAISLTSYKTFLIHQEQDEQTRIW